MYIKAPYPHLNLLTTSLIKQYNFTANNQWSGNHLELPKELGVGTVHIFTTRELQFMRGNWQFKEDTLFTSPDPVGTGKLVDFRINDLGEARSSYLEKSRKYEWGIKNVNGLRFFVPEKLLNKKKTILLNKFQWYCYDSDISRLINELLSCSPSNYEECVKMEWKFLELSYYWLEFLNKKDISRHFYDLSTKQLDAIKLAKFLIEDNYSTPFSIKCLSKKVGLNEDYLKKGFKRLYGYTIRQYMIQLRMEKAKEMVLYEEFPINEICHKLGYSNHGHFTQLYQKFYGYTPLHHRLNHFEDSKNKHQNVTTCLA